MNCKTKILVLLLLLGLTADAQKQSVKLTKNKEASVNQIRNLKVGDKVSDILIPKIINDRYSSVRSTAFKNQLLIIDFWHTRCGSCILGLPKMVSLQHEFGDRIKILPVTFEKKNVIIEFLKINKITKDLVVPTVVEDKILSQLFKHIATPHEVWIYNGKVIAITEADYVNSENIRFILDGGKNDWPVKNDYRPAVDIKTPLVKQDQNRFTGVNPPKRYAAIFGCYQDGVFTKIGTDIDSIRHTKRNYIINMPVLSIYTTRWYMATGMSRWPEPSSIILEVKDPSRFVSMEDTPETFFMRRQKTYVCYESLGPNTIQTPQEMALEVISDLDHLLSLKGRYEKCKMKCLVMVRTDSTDRFKSKGKDAEGYSNLRAPAIKIKNDNLSGITWKINQFYGNPPAFDETGYKGGVDMDFTLSSWQDIPALRKALQPYGLDLKEEERELEVFVLTEKGYK